MTTKKGAGRVVLRDWYEVRCDSPSTCSLPMAMTDPSKKDPGWTAVGHGYAFTNAKAAHAARRAMWGFDDGKPYVVHVTRYRRGRRAKQEAGR